MEFALTEEQRLFADSLRSLLADRVPIEALRRHAETGTGDMQVVNAFQKRSRPSGRLRTAWP